MKKKIIGGRTHQVIEIKKVLCTNEIPILPDCYMGKQINQKESIGCVDKISVTT